MTTPPLYRYAILAICISISATALHGQSPTPRPDTAKRWYLNIQKTGAAYKKSPTIAENDLVRAKLVERIAKDFDGRSIRFRAKVKDVKWKKGIAEIRTETEFPFAKSPTQRQPLRINRFLPFELQMTQEEAVAVRKGQWLEFTGRMKFHPYRHGAVGRSTSTQQLYDLRHEYLGGGYLGTFTATEVACTINGEDVVSRWAEPTNDQELGEGIPR